MIQPFYDKDGITIFCGDNRNVLPLLESETFDEVMTDPPYNVGYSYADYQDAMQAEDYFEWQLYLVSEYERLMKRGASLLYLHYPEFAARMFWAIPELYELEQQEWITWIYNTHNGGKPLRKATRAWIWLSKGEPYFNEKEFEGEYRNPTDKRVKKLIEQGKRPTDYDWWLMEQVKNVSDEKTAHPCQVPLEMAARLIKATTREGDTILDPFLGSGTTALAARETGRKCVGIELSEEYCAEAVKRLKRITRLRQHSLLALGEAV